MRSTALERPMAPHWETSLSEPLMLKSGTTLHTLLDVGHFLRQNFVGERTPPLQSTIDRLLRAAETGADADRHEATVQLSRLLRFNRWI